MANQETQPGTVSKILWHFTGGPKWNSKTNRQAASTKSAADAFSAFKSILKSKELRVGSYAELARVIVPERTRYDREKRDLVTERNVEVLVKSAPVCCLADIPIAHLRYHQRRYGRFAIGFHRQSAVAKGFNPVLYTLENDHLIQSIYQGLAELRSIDCNSVASIAGEISSFSPDAEFDELYDLNSLGDEAEGYIGDIENSVEYSFSQFQKVLAYIKTFSSDEFSTIYCEREWRSLNPFNFSYDDVAMLILPHKVGRNSYYAKFIGQQVKRLNLPRRVPVVPWEDLIEH